MLSKSSPPRCVSPAVALTSKMPSSIVSRDTSKVQGGCHLNGVSPAVDFTSKMPVLDRQEVKMSTFFSPFTLPFLSRP